MAVDPANAAMKFIPWGGAAIHLRRDGAPVRAAARAGHAFCFLPLPVEVGMPAHLNGYFELSSNRRDVWFGEDMAGEGRRRSEWNGRLLEDVVAPVYARAHRARRSPVRTYP